MKLLSAIISIAGFVVLWVLYSGYQHISPVKKLGAEEYVRADEMAIASLASSTLSRVSTSSPSLASTTKVHVVTHIKTPEHVKSIYMSSWVASAPSIRSKLIKLVDDTELNAIVIDVKDNTGLVSWDGRVRDIDGLLDELHSKNIYVIARIAAFQDPEIGRAHV